MAKRKTTNTRKKTTTTRGVRRKPAARARTGNGNFANFFVPLFFIVCIVFCIGFLVFMGYRTVTASAFFDVKAIEVSGAERVSPGDVEKMVRLKTERSGVWNADLNEIRSEIEGLVYVKTAAVSRELPDNIRVVITERVPQAVVRIDGGDFWADGDGVVLNAVAKTDERPPFVLQGWDRSKTDTAAKSNRERVKIYLQMLEEWREFELAKRVVEVDLTNTREPEVLVVDSGEPVKIILGKDNFGKTLKDALKEIAGKGATILAIDVSGPSPEITFRNS